jgi:ABC-type multidrug transport system ATPase subunit
MLSMLTVRETLRFAARLRLPGAMSAEEKNARVEEVIEELGLADVADTYIGNPQKRGISGGERKRVTIGIELITNPSMIFLDEPTSGLDSFTAYNIMQTLVQLAKNGRTIIATIHQPRSNIFELIDQLLVLSAGRIAYYGDAQQSVEYFAQLGHECPRFTNPADYLLDICTIDKRSPELRLISESRVKQILDSHENKKYEAPHGNSCGFAMITFC